MQKVNVLVGRFQPITINDEREVEKLSELPVVAVYVRSHQGYGNTPFKSKTVKRMLVSSGLFADVLYSDDWSDESVSEVLTKNGYTAVKIVKNDHNSLRATGARLALAIGNKEVFENCVPNSIMDYYPVLMQEIRKF